MGETKGGDVTKAKIMYIVLKATSVDSFSFAQFVIFLLFFLLLTTFAHHLHIHYHTYSILSSNGVLDSLCLVYHFKSQDVHV